MQAFTMRAFTGAARAGAAMLTREAWPAGALPAGALRRGRVPAGVLVSLAAMGLLAGCVSDPDEKAPRCPVFLTRPDADHVNRYDGAGRDIGHLVLSVRITDTPGACSGQLGHSVLDAHAHVELLVTRGPAARSREADVQYNIAVFDQTRKLQEKTYTQHVVFPPNVETVQVQGEDVQYQFPTRRGLNGPNYRVYTVLELTPEELAANQRGPR